MLKKRALPTEATAVEDVGVVDILSSLAPLFPRPPVLLLVLDAAEEVDDADLMVRGVGGLLLLLVEEDAADLIESPVPVLLLNGCDAAAVEESLVPLRLLMGDLIDILDSLVPVRLLFPPSLVLKLLLLSNATSTAAVPDDTIAGVAPEFIAGDEDLIGLAIVLLLVVVVDTGGGTPPLPFARD